MFRLECSTERKIISNFIDIKTLFSIFVKQKRKLVKRKCNLMKKNCSFVKKNPNLVRRNSIFISQDRDNFNCLATYYYLMKFSVPFCSLNFFSPTRL